MTTGGLSGLVVPAPGTKAPRWITSLPPFAFEEDVNRARYRFTPAGHLLMRLDAAGFFKDNFPDSYGYGPGFLMVVGGAIGVVAVVPFDDRYDVIVAHKDKLLIIDDEKGLYPSDTLLTKLRALMLT